MTRFPSREINIGGIPLGGLNPIRLQSMTNTSTLDVAGSVAQCIRIIEAGGEYVRLSVPEQRSVEAFGMIRRQLTQAGFPQPLVADIHFRHELALQVAPVAAKVRINPGNYVNSPARGQDLDSESFRQQEMDTIRQRIEPLVNVCREYGTVMRIGTNMGSLSRRIIHQYGHTPRAMVESTLEFLYILEDLGFRQSVISLKASNPLVMIEAYRQMVAAMLEKDMDYPLHLGVTEAGAGEDGRIRSALGIATLLGEGIGDTVRVSLSEAPELEIPFARKLTSLFQNHFTQARQQPYRQPQVTTISHEHPQLPGGHKALVIAASQQAMQQNTSITYQHNPLQENKPLADMIVLDDPQEITGIYPHPIHFLLPAHKWNPGMLPGILPLADRPVETLHATSQIKTAKQANAETLHATSQIKTAKQANAETLHATSQILTAGQANAETLHATSQIKTAGQANVETLHATSQILTAGQAGKAGTVENVETGENAETLHATSLPAPILIPGMEALPDLIQQQPPAAIIPKRIYPDSDPEMVMVRLAVDFGGLLFARRIHGLWIEAPNMQGVSAASIAYSFLQAAGLRITRTEFISCPTCARTSFDLVEVARQLRDQLSDLPGLKIAIMGCVVNGPGEMADADYGILGTPSGKVHIYKGKNVIIRNCQPEKAAGELRRVLRADPQRY